MQLVDGHDGELEGKDVEDILKKANLRIQEAAQIDSKCTLR